MNEYNKKTNLFKKGMYIYLAILAVLVIAGLSVLWAFLSSYQESLPETAANRFADMSEEEWKTLLGEGIYGSPFSNREADVDTAYKELKIKRSVRDSNDDLQIFKIMSDKTELCIISLAKTKGGSFGMTRWLKSKEELAQSFLEDINPQTELFVPKNSTFTVNGTSAKIEGKPSESPFSTVFEKADDKGFVKYTFRAPCGGKEVKAFLNGAELACTIGDNGAYLYDLAGERIKQVLTVPKGSEVYVNNIRLTTEYISEKDVAYPFLNHLEKELPDAPKSTVYTVKGLYNKPTLGVVYNGEELEGEDKGENRLYRFKAGGMDYTVNLPQNTKITVNGVDISGNAEYISALDVEYSEVNSYKEELVNPLKCTVYTLKGMMFIPEIIVKDSNGTDLELVQNSAGSYSCKTSLTKELVDEYTKQAMDFTSDMMEYMFYGRDMLAETFPKALSHTRSGSQAYNSIHDSYSGMYWRRTHTITYNDLYVDGFTQFAENAFVCDVHYDVTGNAVNANRVDYAKGVYHLLFIKSNNVWEIVELALLDE